ncbi:MAG: hypothetical protein VB140_07900 [Burkholderia sp.]
MRVNVNGFRSTYATTPRPGVCDICKCHTRESTRLLIHRALEAS